MSRKGSAQRTSKGGASASSPPQRAVPKVPHKGQATVIAPTPDQWLRIYVDSQRVPGHLVEDPTIVYAVTIRVGGKTVSFVETMAIDSPLWGVLAGAVIALSTVSSTRQVTLYHKSDEFAHLWTALNASRPVGKGAASRERFLPPWEVNDVWFALLRALKGRRFTTVNQRTASVTDAPVWTKMGEMVKEILRTRRIDSRCTRNMVVVSTHTQQVIRGLVADLGETPIDTKYLYPEYNGDPYAGKAPAYKSVTSVKQSSAVKAAPPLQKKGKPATRSQGKRKH